MVPFFFLYRNLFLYMFCQNMHLLFNMLSLNLRSNVLTQSTIYLGYHLSP